MGSHQHSGGKQWAKATVWPGWPTDTSVMLSLSRCTEDRYRQQETQRLRGWFGGSTRKNVALSPKDSHSRPCRCSLPHKRIRR